MAKRPGKSSRSSGKAGNPGFSEPKVQVFTKFAGINLDLSPHDFHPAPDWGSDSWKRAQEEQSDLLPNFLTVTNNADVKPNGTLETRPRITKITDAPTSIEGLPCQQKFTGLVKVFGKDIYLGTVTTEGATSQMVEFPPNSYHVAYKDISTAGSSFSHLRPWEAREPGDTLDPKPEDGVLQPWSDIDFIDNDIVLMRGGSDPRMFSGPMSTKILQNRRYIPKPARLKVAPTAPQNIKGVGELTVKSTEDSTHKYRYGITYTYLNKFGPTQSANSCTVWTNIEFSKWNDENCINISGTVPEDQQWWQHGITHVDIFYVEGDSRVAQFAKRVEVSTAWEGGDGTWSTDWIGPLEVLEDVLEASLSLPASNYTRGLKARQIQVIDNKVYWWDTLSYKDRIYYGGYGKNKLSHSPTLSGGYVGLEPGTGIRMRNLQRFKTQQGANIVTALCDSANSQREFRFNLVETSVAISQDQSAAALMAEKVSGSVGCKSPRGAVVGEDGLYTASRYGIAITTHTMEYNSQLKVEYISDAISPIFTKVSGLDLSNSALLLINGILYFTLGTAQDDLDKVIFCHDTGTKAWWTYTVPTDKPILRMFQLDYEGGQEGLGIITEDSVYLLPTTQVDDTEPEVKVNIQSGEMSSAIPLQQIHRVSQLEFRFDYFVGEVDIIVELIDQFGRRNTIKKKVTHETLQRQLAEYIRVDQVVESYKVAIIGKARMRLTHFMAKIYPKSRKIGMVWGFDSHSFVQNQVLQNFDGYNELRKALIP